MRKVDPVKHEEKRQEIIAAATRCFARDGFRGATISDICAEAKISPGHLYHYFSSKEAIVDAMVEARLDYAAERFRRMAEEEADAVAALVAEIDRGKARHEQQGQVLVLDMLVEAVRNPALGKILREHSRRARTLIGGYLRKAQERGQIDPALDPDLTAAVLTSIVDGMKALPIRDPGIDMKKSAELFKILIARFLTPPR